ncbi:hypothetical protein M2G70_22960 [Vibrio vulnificus]|nr:hypothetical protein [Vibrio vulnificus]
MCLSRVSNGAHCEIIKSVLIENIPDGRFRSFDGSVPEVGDVIALDQGFTFDDGKPGCLVYALGLNGQYRYEALVYETEIGDELGVK